MRLGRRTEILLEYLQAGGRMRTLSVVFYPLLLLLTTPRRWLQNLQAIFSVPLKNWRSCQGSTLSYALVTYWYKNQWHQIKKYGRFSRTSDLADGTFDLSMWWHLTPLSLFISEKIGAFYLVFFSSLSWWLVLAWVSWMTHGLTWQSGVVLYLILTSTLFIRNSIDMQNYSMMGWVLAPLVLYALLQGEWIVMAVALSLVAFLSFTVVFLLGVTVAVMSLVAGEWMGLVALLPAVVIAGYPLAVSLLHKLSHFMDIVRALGLNKNVKYVRTMGGSRGLGIPGIYVLSLWAIFPLALAWGVQPWGLVVLAALPVVLKFINQKLLRFADFQNLYFFYLTCASVSFLMVENPEFWLFAAFFLSINPMYGFIGDYPLSDDFMSIPLRKPVNTHQLEQGMDNLMTPLPKGARIFLAFRDPQGVYDNIYNGYRHWVELIQHIALKREITVVPDLHLVFQHNTEASTLPLWADTPEDLQRVKAAIPYDYLLVFGQERQEMFAGCTEVVSELDLSGCLEDSGVGAPTIYLMKEKGECGGLSK